MDRKILDRYLKQKQRYNNSRLDTIKKDLSNLGLMYMYFEKKLNINDEVDMLKNIDSQELQVYEDYMIEEKNYSKSTLTSHINSIKPYFKYLCSLSVNGEYFLKANPSAILKSFSNHIVDNEINDNMECFSVEEIEKIINATYLKQKGDRNFGFKSSRDRALISLMFNCGLRYKEACKLISFSRLIKNEPDEMIFAFKAKDTKNKNDRRVVVVGDNLKRLREYLDERELLLKSFGEIEVDTIILSKSGKPLTNKAVNDMIKKYKALAGVKEDSNITSHRFRKSLTNELIEKQIDKDTRYSILGWKKNKDIESKYGKDSSYDIIKETVCNII